MPKQKRTKPPSILPKNDRLPSETSELRKKHLDECEAAEWEDWVSDIKKAEWEKSPQYQERKALAEKYKKNDNNHK